MTIVFVKMDFPKGLVSDKSSSSFTKHHMFPAFIMKRFSLDYSSSCMRHVTLCVRLCVCVCLCVGTA